MLQKQPPLIDTEQITYRNDLINQLSIIVKPGVDVWPEIIKKWAQLVNEENPSELCLVKPDKAVINDCVVALGEFFLKTMFGHFESAICSHHRKLKLNKELSESEIQLLCDWIKKTCPLPFEHLTLHVTTKLIKSECFQALMKNLQGNLIESLELCFPEEEIQDLEGILLDNIAKHVNYPVYISTYQDKELKFEKFQAVVISKIREYTKQCRESKGVRDRIVLPKKKIVKIPISKFNPNLQVERVEVHEIAQQVVQVQEEVVECNIEQEIVSTYEEYDGQLIDYNAFRGKPYCLFNDGEDDSDKLYELIKSEFFANLPHAIKYFSPEAAIEVHAKLRSRSAASVCNPFTNFVIKKTKAGELILDYDKFSRKDPKNDYTPRDARPEEKRVIYNVQEQKDIESQLINLWIRYGDDGCKEFSLCIEKCDKAHPGFASFLKDHYLSYFRHWDKFLDNYLLRDSLERIESYTNIQVECLKKFLQNTGISKHNIKDTLNAFDFFWNELTVLCKKAKVDIALINKGSWSTPYGGFPGVYMERLITILKNARDLAKQLEYLNFVLDNHGAYYASKYEGSKFVSKEMLIAYDKEARDKVPFNPNEMLYRVDLEFLVDGLYRVLDLNAYEEKYAWNKECYLSNFNKEASEELLNKQTLLALKLATKPTLLKGFQNIDNFLNLAYRFIIQQEKGITFAECAKVFPKCLTAMGIGHQGILLSLFFITHERYTGKLGLERAILNMDYGAGVYREIIKGLLELYKLDIKLNELEVYAIAKALIKLSQGASDDLPHQYTAQGVIAKLFKHLRQNKYGAIKFLSHINPNAITGLVAPYWYGLEAAEYFMQGEDGEKLGYVYADDLLTFSLLLNLKADKYYKDKEDIQAISEVRKYLIKAVNSEQSNNLDYAFHLMTNSGNRFNYACCLAVFSEIDKCSEYSPSMVLSVLRNYNFPLAFNVPAIFSSRNDEIKDILISLIYTIEHSDPSAAFSAPRELMQYKMDQLNSTIKQDTLAKEIEHLNKLLRMDTTDLERQLSVSLQNGSTLTDLLGPTVILAILDKLKKTVIIQALKTLKPYLCEILATKLESLSNFQEINFERISYITSESAKIAGLIHQLKRINSFDEIDFADTVKAADFSKLDYTTLYQILELLTKLPNIDYLGILKRLLENGIGNNVIGFIERLYGSNFPKNYIESLVDVFHSLAAPDKQETFKNLVIELFEKDNKDELLAFITQNTGLAHNLLSIATCAKEMKCNSKQIAKLLGDLRDVNKLHGFLHAFEGNSKILDLVTKCHGISRKEDYEKADYSEFLKLLRDLGKEEINALHNLCTAFPPSTTCLINALKHREQGGSFADFLTKLEKEPFGKRDLKQHFDTSQVERVINESRDLNNKTRFTYKYRKELMEAFLLVNEAGHELPIYYGKPACNLSNKEIRKLLKEIKEGTLPKSNSDKLKQLYALPILREAMYRATGEHPYSTQIILLIDRIMRGGSVLSDFDTGQGKSLVEIMQCSVVWLYNGGKVFGVTSSTPDATRDLENYGPYLDLLDIRNSRTPIYATSKYEELEIGVYMTTFPDLALSMSCAITEGKDVSGKFSLVISESDDAILDSLVTYRYATSKNAPVGHSQVWVYTAIIDYIDYKHSVVNQGNIEVDIEDLRIYLNNRAKQNKQELPKFDDDQLITWLCSVFYAKNRLRENYDYIATLYPEIKRINGKDVITRLIKPIMTNGRASDTMQYGKGVQQFLYADLNKKHQQEAFAIEPENRTIWVSTTKNIIDLCKESGGSIYGSSATTGSEAEIEEQFDTHGFLFSEIPPHQESKVKSNEPVIVEEEHFESVLEQLKLKPTNDAALMFCKDIETVKRLRDYLEKKVTLLQIFTGYEDEKIIIEKAASNGMVTIATDAFGRNTDIKMQGRTLHVYQLYPDSVRRTGQKGGRTARAGAPGYVYHIYSKRDLGEKPIEEFQNGLDAARAAQRAASAELFNLIGLLNNAIAKSLPSPERAEAEELLLKWRGFRDDIEKQNDINQEQILKAFNKAFGQNIKIQPKTYTAPEKYKVYKEKVKIANCTPPSIMAFELIRHEAPEAPEALPRSILTHVGKENYNDILSCVSKYSLNSVIKVQTNFVSNLLTTGIKDSKGRWFYQRWLYSSSLSDIANNKVYLQTFKVFKKMSGNSVVEFDTIKDSVQTLLEEYLYNSWFISSSRKEEVRELIKNIKKTSNEENVLGLLEDSKVNVFKSDSTKSFWWWLRRIKPLHYYGKSRFQDTLESALELTSALSGKASDVSKLLSMVNAAPDKLDFDNLSIAIQSASIPDTPTGKMVSNSMNKAMERLNITKSHCGNAVASVVSVV